MQINSRQNNCEMVKAEAALEEAEYQHSRIESLLEERRIERNALEEKIERVSSGGDIDELIALQSRRTALDKALAELSASESECSERVESARRYLFKLYVRLERLRQEAACLADNEQKQLMRVKVQIEAIAGMD